ncbi:hypothetical protein TrCOL_g5872 [Triparma columacea]|uniref:Uncharacterized protein n=1 Tax=Triparma columacea TaxID=722753 RepID=A0A9W7GP64_9STRA|nr:hypothetical protein TrCOL_g5872 [Triparma columacea]
MYLLSFLLVNLLLPFIAPLKFTPSPPTLRSNFLSLLTTTQLPPPEKSSILSYLKTIEPKFELESPSPFVTIWTSDSPIWSRWGTAGQFYSDSSVINGALTPFGAVMVRGYYTNVSDSVVGLGGEPCYEVTVTSGLLTNSLFEVPLPIKGKGYLRLLYADEDFRVLQNYKDTKGAWRWENEGGIAVQVRADLVDKEKFDGRNLEEAFGVFLNE